MLNTITVVEINNNSFEVLSGFRTIQMNGEELTAFLSGLSKDVNVEYADSESLVC